MNNDKYITPSEIKKQFGVSTNSLRKWAIAGKIRFIRPNNTRRLYNSTDISKFFGCPETINSKKTICYARVSSLHQKEDLERQVKLLQSEFPDSIIIKDIGSGLNWKRKGFTTLLESINNGDIERVVVTYKDRLCRFGNELVEWIFKKANVKLVVLSKCNEEVDPTRELSEDLLAITNVFVARNNGLRSGRYKAQRRKEIEKLATKEPAIVEEN